MEKNIPYQYFLLALNAWIEEKKINKEPYQKNLSLDIGVTEGTISKYLKNREQKIIPFHSQVAIAEQISGDYLSFLEAGKTIYEISHPKIKNIESLTKHQSIVRDFEDQDRGLRINSKLIYAEKIDHDSLDKIEDLIDLEIKHLKKKEIEDADQEDLKNA